MLKETLIPTTSDVKKSIWVKLQESIKPSALFTQMCYGRALGVICWFFLIVNLLRNQKIKFLMKQNKHMLGQ